MFRRNVGTRLKVQVLTAAVGGVSALVIDGHTTRAPLKTTSPSRRVRNRPEPVGESSVTAAVLTAPSNRSRSSADAYAQQGGVESRWVFRRSVRRSNTASGSLSSQQGGGSPHWWKTKSERRGAAGFLPDAPGCHTWPSAYHRERRKTLAIRHAVSPVPAGNLAARYLPLGRRLSHFLGPPSSLRGRRQDGDAPTLRRCRQRAEHVRA